MTDCAASPRAVIAELADFLDFAEFSELMELTKLTEDFSALQPPPFCVLSMLSLVWNIPIAQPGLAAWLCSPQPLRLLSS